MSMNATTVKMPSTANESAARAASPPSTSSQKSLAGMRAAAAAAAALHEKAQTRDELGGRQRAPARGAVTASLDHALSARQTPDHNAEKAEYARAEREAQQP